MHECQQKRQDDRAERIDVLERIEREAAALLSSIVSKLVSGEPMHEFMADDGRDERQNAANDINYLIIHYHLCFYTRPEKPFWRSAS